jgi:hypothetical protein
MKNDSLNLLLNKYKFANEIPSNVQKHILKSKKRALFSIYKKNKKLSVLVFFAVNLYFLIKRFGLPFTFAKTYVITVVSIAITLGAFAAGSSVFIYDQYFVEKHVYDGVSLVKGIGIEHISDEIKAKPAKLAFSHKLTIIPFEAEDSEAKIAKNILNDIMKHLIRIKRKPVVVIKHDISQAETVKLLIGVIIKLEDTYRISVKIIDKETTEVDFYDVEQVKSQDEISDACLRLARKISSKI